MCECFNCHKIIEELNDIIDNFDDYPTKELTTKLETSLYNKIVRHKKKGIDLYIGKCPNSDEFCEIVETDTMGDGVIAIQDIPSKTAIGCYIGCIDLTNAKTYDWRYAFAYGLNGYIIDGSEKKSMMSIINHSRNPNVNVEYVYHLVNGKKQIHIVFITAENIRKGDELFIDYGDEYWIYAKSLGINEIDRDERPLKQQKITDYFKPI